MLCSVFTPTHDAAFLPETYKSLQQQQHTEFEWLIVPNSDRSRKLPSIPANITRDSRVRVLPAPKDLRTIGALKKYACSRARGDVLVELDHDDLLTPHVLAKIVKAAEDGADFVFSDTAVFHHGSNQPFEYGADYGWKHYDVCVYGLKLRAARNFPVTPRSLSEIFYTPDHVRAWRREVYEKLGGHDERLQVGDDHDLVCRTYLGGYKFADLKCCGYLYRKHEKNTSQLRNAEIQEQQKKTGEKYYALLVQEWLRRNQLQECQLTAAEIPRDDSKQFRWLENTLQVGCISVGADVLPLLSPPQVIDFFREAHRVLPSGGYLRLQFPVGGVAAAAPHFRSRWTRDTLAYFSQSDLADTLPCAGGNQPAFQLFRYSEKTETKSIPGDYAAAELCAIKGQHQPGPVFI